MNTTTIRISACAMFFSAIFLSGAAICAGAPERDVPKKFLVPPPPFTEGIFPCSQCHAGMPANRTPRKLEGMHQNIDLKHMPGGWCFDCHNPNNRDTLRLANGKIVRFEESYNLCGQCHGTILREWKAGLHGKRTGMWNGEKQYRLCVHCHWPHDPRFKQIKPLPPPVNPSDIK
jgi:hypothetical protein